eukprot:5749254-Pleurochrysis_carterae.AAC.4
MAERKSVKTISGKRIASNPQRNQHALHTFTASYSLRSPAVTVRPNVAGLARAITHAKQHPKCVCVSTASLCVTLPMWALRMHSCLRGRDRQGGDLAAAGAQRRRLCRGHVVHHQLVA